MLAMTLLCLAGWCIVLFREVKHYYQDKAYHCGWADGVNWALTEHEKRTEEARLIPGTDGNLVRPDRDTIQ